MTQKPLWVTVVLPLKEKPTDVLVISYAKAVKAVDVPLKILPVPTNLLARKSAET